MLKVKLVIGTEERWLSSMQYEYFYPIKMDETYYDNFLRKNFPYDTLGFTNFISHVSAIKPTKFDLEMADDCRSKFKDGFESLDSIRNRIDFENKSNHQYYHELAMCRYKAGLDKDIIPNFNSDYDAYLRPTESKSSIIEFFKVGGLFDVQFTSTSNDDFFYNWMILGKMKEGIFLFYNGDEDQAFKIEFWDCYCVSIGESMISQSNSPMRMSIRLSPAIIRNRGILFEKAWKITDISKSLKPVVERDNHNKNDEEIKISIIIELPHSKETGWGAKGLSGHTAMAIGNQFFDYGPDYSDKEIDERVYDYDFNKDGDRDDIVSTDSFDRSFKFAPGRPWWGEMIAKISKKSACDVTLSEVIQFVSKHWKNNGVYGTVYVVEFYVTKEQSLKMLSWWKTRYEHLKVYSVFPWTGEQCTTTVKSALQEGGIRIPDKVQKPIKMLEILRSKITSTSVNHNGEVSSVKVIKNESIDWEP